MSNRFYCTQKFEQLFELLAALEQAAENAMNGPNMWLFGLSHLIPAYHCGVDAFESLKDDFNDEQTIECLNMLDDIQYMIQLSGELSVDKSRNVIFN